MISKSLIYKMHCKHYSLLIVVKLQVCRLDVALLFDPQEVSKPMKNKFMPASTPFLLLVEIRKSAIKLASPKIERTFLGNALLKIIHDSPGKQCASQLKPF